MLYSRIMPRMVRLLALSGFILQLSAWAAASHDPWIRIQSEHFELFTTAAERDGIDLIRHFEQVRSFFLQTSGLDGGGVPIRIISFRSDGEYQPYRPNAVADAYFEPGMDHDYIVMKDASMELYPIAVHEYTHLLLRQTKVEVPLWLNEGLAELYSNLRQDGDKIVVGTVIPGRARVLATEKWIELRTLVTTGYNSPMYNEKSRAGMFYAECWALVHMLALDQRYEPKLPVLIDALRSGDSLAALQKAYGKPIERVQSDLRTYLKSPTLYAAVFENKLPPSVEAPQVETGASLPSRLALAELVSNDRTKLEQARAAYQDLASDYPDRWEVEQGWGDFLVRERRNAEAVEHYERASRLGAVEPRMYVAWARALNMTNRSQEALGVLRTAVRLGPGLDTAHFELGVALVRNGGYGEALAEFHQIRNLPTEHAYRYFYNLAYAHSRVGDSAQARALIAKAKSQTRNPEELAALNRLLKSIDAATSGQSGSK